MDPKQLLFDIGNRLYKARQEKGYTQEYLGELSELTTQTISNAENGVKALRPENIIKICKALDISTDYLLTGTDRASFITIPQDDFENMTDVQKEYIRTILENCIKLSK